MAGNKAFVLNGTLSTSFKELPIPQLKGDEVLIEVKKTGICGSDIHLYVEGKLGSKFVTEPMGLGHESSGVIVKVGMKVETKRIGERVAIEPWSVCRVCDYCKSGKCQLCGFSRNLDSPKRGTLVRYYNIPSDLAYKLPEKLGFEEGALMEPLAVAVHAVHSIGKLRAGQHVVVLGCGAVGLLCMAVADAFGAARKIAVDNNAARLQFAAKYTMAGTFMPPPPFEGETKLAYSERSSEILKQTLDMTAGVDLVIDATGAESCIQMAFFVAKAGGSLVQVGIGVTEAYVPINLLITKQLTVKGCSCYGPGDYPLAIALASSGKVNLKPLITHRFDFDDAVSAFETTRAGVDASGNYVLKTMISGVSNEE